VVIGSRMGSYRTRQFLLPPPGSILRKNQDISSGTKNPGRRGRAVSGSGQ
jgi:hypothetical protein